MCCPIATSLRCACRRAHSWLRREHTLRAALLRFRRLRALGRPAWWHPHRLHQLSTTSPGNRGTGLNAGYIDFATSIQHTGDANSRISLDTEGDSSLTMSARLPLKAETHHSSTVQREREQIKEVYPSHRVTGISQPEQKATGTCGVAVAQHASCRLT